MRNTSTDGDYLSLIAVWDCGIDGVETDLSLCLTHGASAAAIPTVQWEAIEINGTSTRKGAKQKKGNEGGKKISSIHSASLYCPNIHNALSLSVSLSLSHSLHWNPDCPPLKKKLKNNILSRVQWSQKHIEEHISELNLKLHSMYTESHTLTAQFLACCFQFAQLGAILVVSGARWHWWERKSSSCIHYQWNQAKMLDFSWCHQHCDFIIMTINKENEQKSVTVAETSLWRLSEVDTLFNVLIKAASNFQWSCLFFFDSNSI